MSAIGELAVSIVGNTRGIKASFKETKQQAKGLQRRMKKLKGSVIKAGKALGTGLVAGITAAGTAAVKATKDTLEYADSIDKTSQRMGLSKEATQEWKYVAEQMGTSLDSLERGMTRFQKRVGEADDGLSSAQRAFENLGVKIKNSNGNLRSMDSIMPETIKKLQSMEDATKRNQLAMELFGRGGKELIPILNSNTENVDKLTQKAHDLGLVMSDENVEASVEFKDKLHSLRSAFEGIKRQIALELMPTMQDWTDYTLENMPEIRKKIDDIADRIINTVKGFKLLWDVTKLLTEPIVDLIVEIALTADLIYQSFEQMVIDTRLSFELLKLGLAELVNYFIQKAGVLAKLPGGLGEKWEGFAKSFQSETGNIGDNVDSLKKASKKNSEDMKTAWKAMEIGFKDAAKNIGDNVSQLVEDYKSFTKNVNENEKEQTETVKTESQKRIKQRKKEVKKAKEAAEEAVTGIRIFKRENGPDLITNKPSALREGEKWEQGKFIEGSGTRKPVTSTRATSASKDDPKTKEVSQTGKVNDMMKKLSDQLKSYIKKSLSALDSMKENIKKIFNELQSYAKNSLKTLNSLDELAQKQTNRLQSIDKKMNKLNKLDSILTALNNLNIDITNKYYNGANQGSNNGDGNGDIVKTLKDRGVGGSYR